MAFSIIDRSRKLRFSPYDSRAEAEKHCRILRVIPDRGIPIGTAVYIMKDGTEGLYKTDLSEFKTVRPTHIKAIEKENEEAGLCVARKRQPTSFANGAHVHKIGAR